MTDITKLVDNWRGEAELYDQFCCTPAIEGCANELESALPKWTKITEDESTWPDEGVRVMVNIDGVSHFAKFIRPAHYGGDYWRPLCNLDHPPESEQ